jgi:uncharacterized protein (DUF1778 family)
MIERQRTVYESAAALEGVSVSALVASAADDRAEEVLHAYESLSVSSVTFDDLLAALDRPVTLAAQIKKAIRKPKFDNR